MLCGSTPFGQYVNKKPPPDMLVFKKIVTMPLKLPQKIDKAARSIIEGFLQKCDQQRLGSKMRFGQGIQAHPFFKKINWLEVNEWSHNPSLMFFLHFK